MVGIDELLHARQAAEKKRYPDRPGSGFAPESLRQGNPAEAHQHWSKHGEMDILRQWAEQQDDRNDQQEGTHLQEWWEKRAWCGSQPEPQVPAVAASRKGWTRKGATSNGGTAGLIVNMRSSRA